MANLTSTLAVRLIDGVSGPAKGAAGALGAIGKATDALGRVRGLREATARLDELSRAHDKARESVRGLAGQLIAADAPSARLQAAYGRATAAADRLGNKVEWQRARVRGAASELDRMGISAGSLAAAEARLRANIDATTAAMRRQEEVARKRALAGGVVGAAVTGVGVKAGVVGKQLAVRAVEDAASLDIAQKKQVAFSGITQENQDRILKPQAKKIAFDTQFNVKDVTQAQTAVMAGLADHLDKAGVAAGITEHAKNFAMAMGSTMTEAAEAARAYMAARQADMTTPDAATKSAQHASNFMIRAAKLGGSSHEDMTGFVKYGMPSARSAGLSEQNTLAMQIALRRAGVRGDEAGVAVRSFAGKLVAPTNKGRAAMLAAGIDHDKFTTMPGGMSTQNLGKTMQAQLGVKLNEATRKAIDAIHENPEITTDRGAYSTAIAEAIEENNGKKLSTKDSQAISRAATQFHKLSVESIDTNGLLEALMAANLTLAQANAIFTDKQGGRAALALGNSENFASDKKALSDTPDDYGAKIADYIMSGLGGSVERFKGAVEATIVSLGEANSGLARFALDGVGGALDKFSSLSSTTQQAATAIGALAAAGSTAYGALRLLGAAKALLGGGSAAALTGSAVALDGSAAALTAAAARLGVAGTVGTVATATGGGVAGGVAGTAGGVLAGVAAAGGIAAGIVTILQDHRPAKAGVTKATAAPGEEHDAGQRRRRAANQAQRDRFLEERRSLGILGDGAETSGSAAGERAGSGIATGIRDKGLEVEAAGRTVLERIKALFGSGIDVPIRLNQSGSVSPAVPPAAPAAPAASPKAAGDKVSSIRGGDVTVHLHGVSGDPNEIASAVSRKVAESAREAMRGSFSDNA